MTSEPDMPDAIATPADGLPAHVPADVVRPFPFRLGPTTFDQPHGLIAEIHEGPPIIWAEGAWMGFQRAWVPRRMADMRAIYMDNVRFSTREFAPFAMLIGESWTLVPAETDPPLHSALRSAINPLFTPRKMAALEDKVRHYARDAIARFRDAGACELMSDFAFEFPIRVFLELMGLPQSQMNQFLAWEHKLLHERNLDALIEATKEIVAYLRSEIRDRRLRPRDDFISYGVKVEADGKPLTEDQLMGFCFNLFVGGLDTVSTNIGLQFRHLAERQDHQTLLRDNPGMIGDAVEEMMRAYAAVSTSRMCIEQVEIGGVTIMPGDRVLMPTYLANRDPEAFADPQEIRFDRKPRHVTFGYGAHMCIGMHLAKREMRVAIEEFLAAIPQFAIPADTRIESYLSAMISPVTLPLVWQQPSP